MILQIGIILLLINFFVSGIYKAINFEKSVKYLESNAFFGSMSNNVTKTIIASSILILLICPVILVLNRNQYLRIIAWTFLTIFLILATVFFHPLKLSNTFYQKIPFLNNLSMLGGFVLLYYIITTKQQNNVNNI